MTQAIEPQMNNVIRESDAYRGRNTSMGALIEEADRIFEALASGQSREEVKQRCFSGDVLRQRTEKSRRRIWASIQHRYFAHEVQWVIDDIIVAKRDDRKAFLDLLYLHYCLRDKLAFDVVTKLIWDAGISVRGVIVPHDVRHLLDDAATDQPLIARWSESTRAKLANSVLTALRDFGLLEGKARKQVAGRTISNHAAEHLVRLLVSEGQRGRSIITDPTWHLFLMSDRDVSGKLSILASENRLRFEKTGSTVVLETPSEWEVGS
jgi:hypothetical protein